MQQNNSNNNYSTNKDTIFKTLKLQITYDKQGTIIFCDDNNYNDHDIEYSVNDITNYFFIVCFLHNHDEKNYKIVTDDLIKTLKNHKLILYTNGVARFLNISSRVTYNIYLCYPPLFINYYENHYEENVQKVTIKELDMPCIISIRDHDIKSFGDIINEYNMQSIPLVKNNDGGWPTKYYIISKKGMLTKCATHH